MPPSRTRADLDTALLCHCVKWHFSLLRLRAATHRLVTHTRTRLLRNGFRLVNQSVRLCPPLCWWCCEWIGTGSLELLGGRRRQLLWCWQWRQKREMFPNCQERGLWFLRGSFQLQRLITGCYLRIIQWIFHFSYNWRRLRGKTWVKVACFTGLCGTFNGLRCCVKRQCCQFWLVGKRSAPLWIRWTTLRIKG